MSDDGTWPNDDVSVRGYGRAVGVPARLSAANVIRRYFGALNAGNGSRACGMLRVSLAARQDKIGLVPEEYVPLHGSELPRSRQCPQFLAELAHLNRARVRTIALTLRVASLRLQGERALAILEFRGLPERYLPLHREQGQWKIGALFDEEIR